jgi:hypothetical protein
VHRNRATLAMELGDQRLISKHLQGYLSNLNLAQANCLMLSGKLLDGPGSILRFSIGIIRPSLAWPAEVWALGPLDL